MRTNEALDAEEPYLAFHVVGDIVHRAPQGDLPDGPGGVVGQVGGEDADPQLALWEKR